MRRMTTRSHEPRGRSSARSGRRSVAASTERPVAVLSTHPGPWGPMHLAATARGIVGLALLSPPDAFEADLVRTARITFGEPGTAAQRHLAQAQRELDEYFGATRQRFEV